MYMYVALHLPNDINVDVDTNQHTRESKESFTLSHSLAQLTIPDNMSVKQLVGFNYKLREINPF